MGRFFHQLAPDPPRPAVNLHGTFTLFGQPASPVTLTSDTASYTMGVEYQVAIAGQVNAVWFYSPPGATVLPGTIASFIVSNQQLGASQAAAWSGAAGSGWVRAPFSSPPPINGNTRYKAAIFINNTGAGNFYGATSHYWDTGPGQGGISNGSLSAPNSAGTTTGQDAFITGTTLAYPNTSFNASNYWVDVEVQT